MARRELEAPAPKTIRLERAEWEEVQRLAELSGRSLTDQARVLIRVALRYYSRWPQEINLEALAGILTEYPELHRRDRRVTRRREKTHGIATPPRDL